MDLKHDTTQENKPSKEDVEPDWKKEFMKGSLFFSPYIPPSAASGSWLNRMWRKLFK